MTSPATSVRMRTVILLASGLAGCGGTQFVAVSDGAISPTDAAAREVEGASEEDGPGAIESGSTTDGMVDGAATGDGPEARCPDVQGGYAATVSEGQGCGDLSLYYSTSPCIRQGPACVITFQSSTLLADGGPATINGSAVLSADGTFANANLILGTQERTGCSGAWDPSTSTMTVDCGGMDASQSCVLALRRDLGTCK